MAEGKSNKDCDYYQTYLPPPKLGKWDGFMLFLWNSEKKEFLGRTGTSWLKVTVFYIIFYICLAAFFAIMLVIFYQTLDYYKPKWTLEASLIGNNPGLGFRPMPEKAVDSTLIWFQRGQASKWLHWTESLDKFLQPYDFGKQYGNTFKKCSHEDPISDGKVCMFDFKTLGGMCTVERKFGYEESQPCVAIKMNKIWGWKPDPFVGNLTDGEIKDYKIPHELLQQIKTSTNDPLVWLTCEGENPADRENIGELKYFPKQGFPTYFFPFTNTPGYLAPIVMVQFKSLQPGILVNVECKAWARNIKHNRMERKGSVHFEILMD